MKHRLKIVVTLCVMSLASCTSIVDPAPVDCTISDLTIEIQNIQPATDCTSGNGELMVVAEGGTGSYEYKLEGGFFQASSQFQGLLPGLYTVIVMDNGGCEKSTTASIASASGITIDEIVTMDSGCGTSNGSISVSVSGGSGFSYKLDDGEFASSSTFANLAAGDYQVFIRESGGCVVVQNVKVKAGIEFDVVQSILNTTCAVSDCHDGSSSSRPNWTIDENIRDFSSQIKSRVNDKSMPPASSGLSLSDEEIQQITCWVDDGAILN